MYSHGLRADDRADSLLRARVVVYSCIVITVLVIYGQTVFFDFVNYDDPKYVTKNSYVTSPFTWESVAWAFTTGYLNNWHPLTWLSHQLDSQVFGVAAGGRHAVNVGFHLLNALLLFESFLRMTRGKRTDSAWCCAFIAVFFAVHPLRVESVAWISARKDVLSGFFAFLTLLAYAHYAERPSLFRYLTVAAPFSMALMSKSIVVTLPCLLLLLDYWPLERIDLTDRSNALRQSLRLALEKVPLFALSCAAGVIAIVLRTPQTIEGGARASEAFASYIRYIGMMFWPMRLAILYPHSKGTLPLWLPVTSVIALALMTAVSVLLARRYRYVLVGWLWYVVALLPAIGFIQLGTLGMADRYTYIPSIGLSVILVFGLSDLWKAWDLPPQALAGAGALVIAALAVLAVRQTQLWKDSITVFEHATQVTSNNSVAHYNLGSAYLARQRYADAGNEFYAAMQGDPSSFEAPTNLGVALLDMGKVDDAIRCFHAALSIKPDHVEAMINLGIALVSQGNSTEGTNWLKDSLSLEPNNADIHYNLGVALHKQGMYPEAAAHFQAALSLQPDYVDAAYALALSLEKTGRPNDAIQVLSQLVQLKPDHTDARKTLERIQGTTPSH